MSEPNYLANLEKLAPLFERVFQRYPLVRARSDIHISPCDIALPNSTFTFRPLSDISPLVNARGVIGLYALGNYLSGPNFIDVNVRNRDSNGQLSFRVFPAGTPIDLVLGKRGVTVPKIQRVDYDSLLEFMQGQQDIRGFKARYFERPRKCSADWDDGDDCGFG